MLSFHTPGEPAAQGSKRHVGNGRMIEMSKKLPAWREAIKTTAAHAHQGHPPIDVPVHVTVRFYMPRPKKPRFPTPAVAPDLDKLCRAVGDALEQSGVLQNDSRITHWSASKHYAGDDGPGAHITITPAPPSSGAHNIQEEP